MRRHTIRSFGDRRSSRNKLDEKFDALIRWHARKFFRKDIREVIDYHNILDFKWRLNFESIKLCMRNRAC